MTDYKMPERAFMCWWNPRIYRVDNQYGYANPELLTGSSFTTDRGYSAPDLAKIENLGVGETARLDNDAHIITRVE